MTKNQGFRKLLVFLKTFWRSETGVTLPLLALSMVMVVGLTGLAIDTGRAQLVQSKLQFSLDAAGLAAGSTASTSDLTTEVNKYLNANFNGYLGATLTGVTATANSTITGISVSATATLPTVFMQIVNIPTVTVTGTTQISRQISGLEVTVIIDTSYGDDLTDFKAGLTAFINTLFQSAAGQSNNLYISIVPFNQTVNIGSANTAWLNPSSVSANNASGWGPSNSWGGCVMARSGSEATIDDPPTSGNTLWNQYYYASETVSTLAAKEGWSNTTATNDFNGGPSEWETINAAQQTDPISSQAFANDYGVNLWQGSVSGTQQYASPLNSNNQGPNFMCPPAIVPLTNNQATVLNAINSITDIQGDWLPDQGLEWGWNTISPRWRGYWTQAASPSLPYNYNTPGWNKALVWVEGYETGAGYVFQQGNYIDNHIYGGYGYLSQGLLGSTDMTTAINQINTNATNICAAMKAQNVFVYLLGYSSNGSASGLPSFMSSCATGQNYAFWFGPGDWNAFNTALNSIADSLVRLWLSK
jgi:Flp pilus assembly protein TadG